MNCRLRANRRTVVRSGGVALLAGLVGCLGDAPTGGDHDEADDGNGDDESGDTGASETDSRYRINAGDWMLADESAGVELTLDVVDPWIEPDDPARMKAKLINGSEEEVTVTSGAPAPFGVVTVEGSTPDEERLTLWTDAYEESEYVGTDGKSVTGVDDIGLAEELAPGESFDHAFELHETTPGIEGGRFDGTVGVGVEPEDGEPKRVEVDLELIVEEWTREATTEDPRVDEPPHEIDPSEVEGSDDEWNDDYLGEAIDEEPTLEFERLVGVRRASPFLSAHDEAGEYAVTAVTNEDERDALIDVDTAESDVRERVESLDFDEECLVVVESGFGSSSVSHRWRRVESAGDGVHLHGYYLSPLEQTADYSPRSSTLVVERPDELDLARVSLTVSEDERVHFNSTEGPVTPEE